MLRFDVMQPTTLGEAIQFLGDQGETARPLAGGTDLLVAIKLRVARPRYLVNLKRIAGLNRIGQAGGGGLHIGALARIGDVARSPLILAQAPMVAYAAGQLGSEQVRNLATVGGNLCNASPSADTAPALLALDALARISGPGGDRAVELGTFFAGPGRTVLGSGELLVGLDLPRPAPHTAGCYIKHEQRRMMDCAIVGVAVVLTLDDGLEHCTDIRIALGAVAPTPFRARQAEDLLRGQPLSEPLLAQAAEAAAQEARPISDIRGSAEYRLQLIRVLLPRAMRQAQAAARAA